MDCRLFTYIKVGDLVGKTAVFGKEAVLRKINITKKFEKNKKKAPKSEDLSAFSGAAGRIRTADLILTKDALYRLSYSSIKMATRNGLEPSTSSVTG